MANTDLPCAGNATETSNSPSSGDKSAAPSEQSALAQQAGGQPPASAGAVRERPPGGQAAQGWPPASWRPQLPRMPSSAAALAGAARVLPPAMALGAAAVLAKALWSMVEWTDDDVSNEREPAGQQGDPCMISINMYAVWHLSSNSSSSHLRAGSIDPCIPYGVFHPANTPPCSVTTRMACLPLCVQVSIIICFSQDLTILLISCGVL